MSARRLYQAEQAEADRDDIDHFDSDIPEDEAATRVNDFRAWTRRDLDPLAQSGLSPTLRSARSDGARPSAPTFSHWAAEAAEAAEPFSSPRPMMSDATLPIVARTSPAMHAPPSAPRIAPLPPAVPQLDVKCTLPMWPRPQPWSDVPRVASPPKAEDDLRSFVLLLAVGLVVGLVGPAYVLLFMR